jgi:hypothetical protein
MEFVVLAGATWRTASMLVHEDGPFGVFGWIRYVTGVRFDTASRPFASNGLSTLFLCVWCMSVWTGLAWTAAWLAFGPWAVLAATPLALSAVAAALEEITHAKG